MNERSTDIEFDFFDEPVTQEAPPRPRTTRGGPRGPRRPSTGLTPLLRLVGLIAFAILIVVLLVFWIQSCREQSKRNTYENYMSGVRTAALTSEGIGRNLTRLLTTPGIKQPALLQQLDGLAQQ